MIDRLDFEDRFAFRNDVDLIAMFQFVPLVAYRQSPLASVRDSGAAQLEAQAFFVDTLQQAWSELAMDVDSQSDYPPRKVVVRYDIHENLSALVGRLTRLHIKKS